MIVVILLLIAFIPMVAEARIAARHDRALRAAGALEPAGDVYNAMRFAYPACFLAMAAEAWARGADLNALFAAGVVVFAVAKGLKYWAIATLGGRWTFRVLVPPGSSRTVSGPYRFVDHPNYVAVAGELAGMALMAHAPLTGTLAVLGFGALMHERIRVEEQALSNK